MGQEERVEGGWSKGLGKDKMEGDRLEEVVEWLGRKIGWFHEVEMNGLAVEFIRLTERVEEREEMGWEKG